MSETGFDALMDNACAVWGYCGCMKNGEPLHVTQFIPPDGPVHAEQFVEWLLLADNVNPNLPKYEHQKAALLASFVSTMGSKVVDASLLKWSHCEADAAMPDSKDGGLIPDPLGGGS